MSNVAKNRRIVKLTSNFKRNLSGIEQFLDANEALVGFDALLEELSTTVIPNLRLFPAMGRPLLEAPAHKQQGHLSVPLLINRSGASPALRYSHSIVAGGLPEMS